MFTYYVGSFHGAFSQGKVWFMPLFLRTCLEGLAREPIDLCTLDRGSGCPMWEKLDLFEGRGHPPTLPDPSNQLWQLMTWQMSLLDCLHSHHFWKWEVMNSVSGREETADMGIIRVNGLTGRRLFCSVCNSSSQWKSMHLWTSTQLHFMLPVTNRSSVTPCCIFMMESVGNLHESKKSCMVRHLCKISERCWYKEQDNSLIHLQDEWWEMCCRREESQLLGLSTTYRSSQKPGKEV